MTRGPDEHYRIADTLLAELSLVGPDAVDLPFVRLKTVRAQIHAALAACPDWYAEYDGYDDATEYRLVEPPPRIETRYATNDRL